MKIFEYFKKSLPILLVLAVIAIVAYLGSPEREQRGLSHRSVIPSPESFVQTSPDGTDNTANAPQNAQNGNTAEQQQPGQPGMVVPGAVPLQPGVDAAQLQDTQGFQPHPPKLQPLTRVPDDSRTRGQGAEEQGGTGIASVPGSPQGPLAMQVPGSALPGAPGAAPQQPAPVQEVLKESCYTLEFRHKPITSHMDGEACLHHENLLELVGENINAKTLCVRVNGTPVRHTLFKGKPQTVTIAAVAGPRAVITASYCTGQVQCDVECKVPKDEFMSALGLGGGDTAPETNSASNWNAKGKAKGQTADESKLEKEIQEVQKLMAGTGPGGKNIFKDWTRSKPNEVACQNHPNSPVGGPSRTVSKMTVRQ